MIAIRSKDGERNRKLSFSLRDDISGTGNRIDTSGKVFLTSSHLLTRSDRKSLFSES